MVCLRTVLGGNYSPSSLCIPFFYILFPPTSLSHCSLAPPAMRQGPQARLEIAIALDEILPSQIPRFDAVAAGTPSSEKGNLQDKKYSPHTQKLSTSELAHIQHKGRTETKQSAVAQKQQQAT